MSASTERVRAALVERGLDCEIIDTERSARTAQEAADAVGASVGQIVKSLVFLCDGAGVMALVSGANRLDERKLGAVAGGKISRADADAVRDEVRRCLDAAMAGGGYVLRSTGQIFDAKPGLIEVAAETVREYGRYN